MDTRCSLEKWKKGQEMGTVQKFKIGDNEYTITMFDPISAFEFLHDHAEVRENKRSLGPLGKRAFAQCLDPMLRPLGVPENFQAWFSQHPGDMMHLERMAMEALMSPFVSSGSDTGGTAKS